jgi:glutathione S-transferase
MIDSEFARLLVRHYGLEFREEDHLFGWVSLLTLLHGGYGRVPLLFGSGVQLSGPREVLQHFDRSISSDRRLLPDIQPLRRAVELDLERFNGQLAEDVAAVCYYHMLPDRIVMSSLFGRSVPPFEAKCVLYVYPALRWLFSLLLRLKEPRIKDAAIRIRIAVAHIDRRLADGRTCISGESLTVADLALASALAPLILPPDYIAPVPQYDQMPPELKSLVTELRETPTGKLVQRFYSKLSNGKPPPIQDW